MNVFRGAAKLNKEQVALLFHRVRKFAVFCPSSAAAFRACDRRQPGGAATPSLCARGYRLSSLQVDAAVAPKGAQLDWRLVRKVVAQLGAFKHLSLSHSNTPPFRLSPVFFSALSFQAAKGSPTRR